MILNTLETIVSPIIFIMGWVFQGLLTLTASAGSSIILLSVLVTILTYPLGSWAQKVELLSRERKRRVEAEVAIAVRGLRGEERFRETERIYLSNGYHPISSISLGLPLFVMLPFLLSALFLFFDHSDLVGTPFLFFQDLSQPDGVAGGLNLLPFVMTGITLIDARTRFVRDRGAFIRFLVIAAVLFVLVYNFASGILLYWTISNLMALLSFLWRRSHTST